MRNIYSLLIVYVILAMFLYCCTGEKIYNLVVKPVNAIQVTMKFDIRIAEKINFKYWETSSPDETFIEINKPSRHHQITLFNLKPGTRYGYVIEIAGSEKSFSTDTSFFTTLIPEPSLPELSLSTDSGNVFNGFIMIRTVEGLSRQLILDNRANIVWYHDFDSTVTRFYSWTNRNTVLSLDNEDHIHEFDLEGNTIFELNIGEKGFSKFLHHEIIRDNSGRILSLTRNMQLFDLSEFGGNPADTVYGDGILVLDSTGNRVWEWDMYKYSDPLEDDSIKRMRIDWSHGNSLSIDADGNYLVSFRNFHQVWKINSSSGDIIWKLGLKGDFELKEENLFYSQHSVFTNRFNEITIFDNGLPGTYSRLISFNMTADSQVVAGRYNLRLPASLYTVKEGSGYFIDDDKILFCSSRNNVIVVINTSGNILWELHTPEPVYRAYYIDDPELFNF
ncbi:MAG TPA: aryl-sulfate sulfotransferase [Cyclobacteriaceae bacterium]|nr:aryl-sulfate sulfotransferase [Cyclobacteriaceae bacterium]